MSAVAFITTCKGRLHHLQQTLPTLVALAPSEIIVVDYNCPANTAQWVSAHYPQVKVVHVTDDAGFCLPRARNLGAAQTTSPWLCFIDADIKVKSGFDQWLEQHLTRGFFYRADAPIGVLDRQTDGTFVCHREDFLASNGYDETFRGWGGEDTDLYQRLELLDNCKVARYPYAFVEPIGHEDDERTTFHPIKSVPIQDLINRCYLKTKLHLLQSGIREIPTTTLKHLMKTLNEAFTPLPAPPKTFRLRFILEQLSNVQGQAFSLELSLRKQRRYQWFGPREMQVKTLAQYSAPTP